MTPNFIYHVTRPAWLTNGINRLCFRQYVRPPADQPFRDHAPLNAAQNANQGSEVFAAFFFSDEDIAVTTAFEVLACRPHVVLRASISDPALSHLMHAADDRDLTPGAHMRYGHDTCAPVDTPDGCRVHPSWGIPFHRLEVKSPENTHWVPLSVYLAELDGAGTTSIALQKVWKSEATPYTGVRKLFGWLEAATFAVQLDGGRVAHMQAQLPHEEDYYVVVLVDTNRFVELWRQPLSSHLDVAHNTPKTWPKDYKYADAVDGFSHGRENPVPLAQVSCRRSSCDVVEYKPHFHFFKRKVVIGHAGDPCLSFVNGITRTIYLLSNGAKSFPILCERGSAELLIELAGWKNTPPMVLSTLKDRRSSGTPDTA